MQKMSFKEKAANFWYYHKYHTLAGILGATIVITGISQCSTKPSYDFDMVYVSSNYCPTALLEQKTAEVLGDLNGDGEAHVFCDSVIIPEEPKSDADFDMLQKLTLTFVDGESRMYIMDSDYFKAEQFAEMFEDLSLILPREKLGGAIEYGGVPIAIPTSSCPFLKNAEISGENLYVGILAKTETQQNSVKNLDALYDASVNLIKTMTEQ